jgi:pyruvate,water dikinase
VVAREYGIPAVVSAKGALRFIKTGDVVQLDGSKGTVEVIES